jgi:HSP20 family molecular chaperone IbpA
MVGVAETGWIWSYVRHTALIEETGTADSTPVGPLWHPPADVYSTGDSWWITLALPGVKRSCVHCEVREGALHIRASREAPWRRSARALLSLEIPYGRFERRFTLPDPDAQIISADLIDGCLQIELAAPPATTRPR